LAQQPLADVSPVYDARASDSFKKNPLHVTCCSLLVLGYCLYHGVLMQIAGGRQWPAQAYCLPEQF
jgi:hypothetical protein